VLTHSAPFEVIQGYTKARYALALVCVSMVLLFFFVFFFGCFFWLLSCWGQIARQMLHKVAGCVPPRRWPRFPPVWLVACRLRRSAAPRLSLRRSTPGPPVARLPLCPPPSPIPAPAPAARGPRRAPVWLRGWRACAPPFPRLVVGCAFAARLPSRPFLSGVARVRYAQLPSHFTHFCGCTIRVFMVNLDYQV
jgi:hypothetical protein